MFNKIVNEMKMLNEIRKYLRDCLFYILYFNVTNNNIKVYRYFTLFFCTVGLMKSKHFDLQPDQFVHKIN